MVQFIVFCITVYLCNRNKIPICLLKKIIDEMLNEKYPTVEKRFDSFAGLGLY